jgi:hypothetical protein
VVTVIAILALHFPVVRQVCDELLTTFARLDRYKLQVFPSCFCGYGSLVLYSNVAEFLSCPDVQQLIAACQQSEAAL